MKRYAVCLFWIALIACVADASDHPVPTHLAASKFTVPEGFKVTLFAGEPEIVQPIAFTFDDRGRMWVVECLSYPKWRDDGKGNDRVVILEDTNGDGKHDKKTVVLDNGVNLSGIEVGYGGVWLCSTPNLIFIPITDDKPSGPPAVLLDGWNLKDAKHNVFNGLAWGHDGWLYGTNGIQTKSHVGPPGTPKEQRTFLDCGIWRYHPIRKTFEVYAVGMTNPWGVDWDRTGELFVTNCVIDHLWHIVPGGRYQRMYGQDWDRYANAHMPSAVDYKHWGGGDWTSSRADQKTGVLNKEHDDAGGGHAHSGIAIYNGTQFPEPYQNTLFTCNIHGARLNNDALVRTPSGMKGERRPDFAFANDPWFRGVAVKQGPDGSLYVADWTDTGECHNYEVADTSNGRIYRISYGQPARYASDVTTLDQNALVDAILSRDAWRMRRALRVLQERCHADSDAQHTYQTLLKPILTDTSDSQKVLQALWAWHNAGGDESELLAHINHPTEAVRVQAVRLLSERAWNEGSKSKLLKQLRQEKSVFVRNAYASAIMRLSPDDQLRFAPVLLSQPNFSRADEVPYLEWFAIRKLLLTHPIEGLDLLRLAKHPHTIQQLVSMHLSLPNTTPTAQLSLLTPYLQGELSAETKQQLVAGILEAFQGRKDVTLPSDWSTLLAQLSRVVPEPFSLLELGLLLSDSDSQAKVTSLIDDQQQKPTDRQAALRLLIRYPHRVNNLSATLERALSTPELRSAALTGLHLLRGTEPATWLVQLYPELSGEEQQNALHVLSTRPEFASVLLDAIAAGTIPKTSLTAFNARQILGLKNQELKAKLEQVWGVVRPASATRVEQTSRLKSLLTPEFLAKADLAHGRRLYAVSCGTCHKLFGEGGNLGPELTGAQRSSLDYILENVLDPSAVVAREYRLETFNLIDGRTLSGIVKQDRAQTITIRTVTDEVIIDKDDLESRKPSQQSIMPDGLFDQLSPEQLRDLIGYLASPMQVPLPEK